MIENNVLLGDNLKLLKKIESNLVNLIYLDPPFFTNKKHVNSKNDRFYEFNDMWESIDEYLAFLKVRFIEMKRILRDDGSLFVHIDKSASHYVKVLLDEIFGIDNFRSEIIWCYKRWSNGKRGLLNNHQVIFFYSKSKLFKFNTLYTDYSATTNLDQIFQERVRDSRGKAVYKKDKNGKVVIGGPKKGVPLSDVWEIPFLNPKAKERVGYPTQKPILLLERIIKIVTDENDLVFDPFCGSGTTLVAAKLLNRRYFGIDISKDAVNLAISRLELPVRSESVLLKKGKAAYLNKDDFELSILNALNAKPVQRNRGIDGYLDRYIDGKPVPIKIQKKDQSLSSAIQELSASKKGVESLVRIVVKTNTVEDECLFEKESLEDVKIIESYEYQLEKIGLKTDDD